MAIIILIAYVPALMNVMKNSGPKAPTFLPANPTPGIKIKFKNKMHFVEVNMDSHRFFSGGSFFSICNCSLVSK